MCPSFLSPPPHFRGQDRERPVTIYRRHLPHWRQPEATYFITFRLNDSLPQSILRELRQLRRIWEEMHPEPRGEGDWREYARRYTRLAERWLDEGYGDCHLKLEKYAKLLLTAMSDFQSKRYFLGATVIMPNHCHAVIKPYDQIRLESIVGSWKQYTSRRMNQELGRTGALWGQECYDRIVRDVDHLRRIMRYMAQNPVKAKIPGKYWNRWTCPEWNEAGWTIEAAD